MYCPMCGIALEDDANFCAACGAKIEKQVIDPGEQCLTSDGLAHRPDIPAPVQTSENDSAGELLEDTATAQRDDLSGRADQAIGRDAGAFEDGCSSEDQIGGMGKRSMPSWRVVAAVAVAVIVVIAIGVFAIPNVFSSQVELTDDQITSDLKSVDWDSEQLTNSQWGNNDGYQVESVEVISNEPYEIPQSPDLTARLVRSQTVLSNSMFRVTVVNATYYQLDEGGSWTVLQSTKESVSAEPIGPISDERLISSVPSFMSSIDELGDGPNGDSLMDLYGEGATFTVLENDTGAQGGSAVIRLVNDAGLYSCSGELTVGFSSNGSDWDVASCVVNEGAYQKDFSALIGEYVGLFDHVESIAGDARHCLGGRANPLKINVKSFDPVGSTITIDLSFVVHAHEDPDNTVEQSPGDSVYTISDVIVPLDFSDRYRKVYEVEDIEGTDSIEVYFSLSKNSAVLDVHIEESNFTKYGPWGTFDDYYTVDFAA